MEVRIKSECELVFVTYIHPLTDLQEYYSFHLL